MLDTATYHCSLSLVEQDMDFRLLSPLARLLQNQRATHGQHCLRWWGSAPLAAAVLIFCLLLYFF